MYRALLIDDDTPHAERLSQQLQRRCVEVELVREIRTAISILRRRAQLYELVIINASDATQPWLNILDRLQEACHCTGSYPTPLFLCVSITPREPQFELGIERKGVRYVHEH